MVGPDEWDPAAVDADAAPRALREYLAALDDAAFGAGIDVPPKPVAPSDPAAKWTGAGGGNATFVWAVIHWRSPPTSIPLIHEIAIGPDCSGSRHRRRRAEWSSAKEGRARAFLRDARVDRYEGTGHRWTDLLLRFGRLDQRHRPRNHSANNSMVRWFLAFFSRTDLPNSQGFVIKAHF